MGNFGYVEKWENDVRYENKTISIIGLSVTRNNRKYCITKDTELPLPVHRRIPTAEPLTCMLCDMFINRGYPSIRRCYPCKLTPKGVFSRGVKIVHVMRNPKDVIVSCYYHMKIMAGELFQLSFQEFLPLMIGDYGTYFFYPWFKYVKEWERFSKKHPDQILNIYYEDLKEDSVREIKKIDKFLGTGQTDDVIKDIAEACRFKNLKKTDADVKLPEEFMIKAEKPCLYRLGEVGDWKNHFTLEQNEQVDAWIEENLVETELSFKYTL